MPGVTRDQITRAKEIGIEEYILKSEPDNTRRVGSAYYLKDHQSLEISNGMWNWHSQGVGGKNVIDYLIKVRGYGFVDAVRHLAGDDYSISLSPPQKARPPNPPKQSPERMPFKPPPRNADNDRVIAYLESRGIPKPVILECISRGLLYESGDNRHNCCFIGRDENGKARFCAVRGTRGDFKRDADGSDKRFGFTIPPKSAGSAVLMVYESPIDLLSHTAMLPDFDGWRLSLGGTALTALTRFIGDHPEIRHCAVCTDNDEAGNRAAAEIAEKLQIEVSRSAPPAGKDWNEALQQSTRIEVKEMEDVRKNIVFRDSGYKPLFTVKDGDSIKITVAYDGEELIRKCRWIDEAHTKIGSEYYHNDEFSSKAAKVGNRYEAVPNPKPKIDILAAKYGEDLQAVEIPMTEAALRKLVGGSYETATLYYPSRTEQIKDRKVEIKGEAFGAVIRGKEGIAVCGLTDGVLTSLHPYNAQTCKRELSPAMLPKKPSLLGNLDKKKAIVAERKANAEPTKAKLYGGLEVS
jgi:hypothetical protein